MITTTLSTESLSEETKDIRPHRLTCQRCWQSNYWIWCIIQPLWAYFKWLPRWENVLSSEGKVRLKVWKPCSWPFEDINCLRVGWDQLHAARVSFCRDSAVVYHAYEPRGRWNRKGFTSGRAIDRILFSITILGFQGSWKQDDWDEMTVDCRISFCSGVLVFVCVNWGYTCQWISSMGTPVGLGRPERKGARGSSSTGIEACRLTEIIFSLYTTGACGAPHWLKESHV